MAKQTEIPGSMGPPPIPSYRPQSSRSVASPGYPRRWDNNGRSSPRNAYSPYRERRGSNASSTGSQYSRPYFSPRESPRPSPRPSHRFTPYNKSGVEKNDSWRYQPPRVKDKTNSQSSLTAIADGDISEESLQTELDRYKDQSRDLTRREWVPPLTPRGSVKRISAQDFNREKVIALKRWSQVQIFMYGMSTSTLRDTDVRQPQSAYAPGVIFSAPTHTSDPSEEMQVKCDDPHLTATPFGTVYSKFRKMVVVRCFAQHCLYVPIYTFNGKGLDGKDSQSEYVSIRDKTERNPAPDEGPHKGLRAVRDTHYAGTFIKGRSVIKMTEVCYHRYEAPATIEGRLEDNGDNSRLRFSAMAKRLEN
ncbi:hypothetical protein M426DRAFT_26125 [Hypoxylon sp. CI-4A]|nr:hypothetical protein M426DRAFT_26125 [Hypoxylon sp. CI-4A]